MMRSIGKRLLGKSTFVFASISALLTASVNVSADQWFQDKYHARRMTDGPLPQGYSPPGPYWFQADTGHPHQITIAAKLVPHDSNGHLELAEMNSADELDWHMRIAFPEDIMQKYYGLSATNVAKFLRLDSLDQKVPVKDAYGNQIPNVFAEWMPLRKYDKGVFDDDFWSFPEILEFLGGNLAEWHNPHDHDGHAGKSFFSSNLINKEIWISGTLIKEQNEPDLDWDASEVHPVDGIAYEEKRTPDGDAYWRIGYFANSSFHQICDNMCDTPWYESGLFGDSTCGSQYINACGTRKVEFILPIPANVAPGTFGSVVRQSSFWANKPGNPNHISSSCSLVKLPTKGQYPATSVSATHLKCKATIPAADKLGSVLLERWHVKVGKAVLNIGCEGANCLTDLGMKHPTLNRACFPNEKGCVRRYRAQVKVLSSEGLPANVSYQWTPSNGSQSSSAEFQLDVNPNAPNYSRTVTAKATANILGSVSDEFVVEMPRPTAGVKLKSMPSLQNGHIQWSITAEASSDHLQNPSTAKYSVTGLAQSVKPYGQQYSFTRLLKHRVGGIKGNGETFHNATIQTFVENGWGEKATSTKQPMPIPRLSAIGVGEPKADSPTSQASAATALLPFPYKYRTNWNFSARGELQLGNSHWVLRRCNSASPVRSKMGKRSSSAATKFSTQFDSAISSLIAQKAYCPLVFTVTMAPSQGATDAATLTTKGEGEYELKWKSTGLRMSDCVKITTIARDGFDEVAQSTTEYCGGVGPEEAQMIRNAAQEASNKLKAKLQSFRAINWIAGKLPIPPRPVTKEWAQILELHAGLTDIGSAMRFSSRDLGRISNSLSLFNSLSAVNSPILSTLAPKFGLTQAFQNFTVLKVNGALLKPMSPALQINGQVMSVPGAR